MQIPSSIVTGAVSVMVIQTLMLRTRKKLIKELVAAGTIINMNNDDLQSDLKHLVHIINTNNIELDEFDLIVLKHVASK